MGMKRGTQTALALFLAALPVPVLRAAEIHVAVDALREALADPSASDEKIHARAQGLFGAVPSVQILLKPALRGWDREPDPKPLPATVSGLIEAARKRLTASSAVPSPELAETAARAEVLDSMGLVNLDRERRLQDNEMGVYFFSPRGPAPGDIRLNNILPFIAMKVGEAFASATLIHEAAHALDHARGLLKPEEVVEGEIAAFTSEYLYLKAIDPFGERLARLVTELASELRESRSRLTAAALDFAKSLDVLAGTGGDREKLRQYILSIGYREGDGRRPHEPPSA